MVLVRHGAIPTPELVAGHKGCPGLSALGHRQANALAERLGRTDELGAVAALYTSLMRRAIDTAAPLSAALGVRAQPDCAFCELHDGEADGLPIAEAAEKFWLPGSQSSRHLPWNPNAPAAESLPELVARAAGALVPLAYDHAGETVIVVTHAGVIRGSFMCFGDESFRSSWSRGAIQHTSLTEWLVHRPDAREAPAGMGQPAALVRFDDASHLENL